MHAYMFIHTDVLIPTYMHSRDVGIIDSAGCVTALVQLSVAISITCSNTHIYAAHIQSYIHIHICNHKHKYVHLYIHIYTYTCNIGIVDTARCVMGWLRLVGSLKLQVSFAKEPYKTDDILQKRRIILRSLLIEATPYTPLVHVMFLLDSSLHIRIYIYTHTNMHLHK